MERKARGKGKATVFKKIIITAEPLCVCSGYGKAAPKQDNRPMIVFNKIIVSA